DHRRRHARRRRGRPHLLHRPVPRQAPRRQPRQAPPHGCSMSNAGRPRFFATPEAFREWLAGDPERAAQLLFGVYKKGSGRPSITGPESVDQALCFGWIDGVRKNAGDHAYTIRFTPRKPTSIWSRINVDKVEELTKRGLMRPMGLRAYAARTEART